MSGLVVVSGACGFVGSALCRRLVAAGYPVRGLTRLDVSAATKLLPNVQEWRVCDLTERMHPDRWDELTSGATFIVHLAARAHILQPQPMDTGYRRLNCDATVQLAAAGVRTNVRRFIYLSTIKVHGESVRDACSALTENVRPEPQGPYAVSKWAAEMALHDLTRPSSMSTVILRPPLVYGPGVKANFLRLMQWADARLPWPFCRVQNSRTLIYVDNLTDIIVRCLDSEAAANKTFLVGDDTLSTHHVFMALTQALGRKPRLLSIPPRWLRVAARVLRKEGEIERLMDSLVIDSTRLRSTLNWVPPVTFHDAVQETANWFRSRRNV